ncbi:hypothetical protein G9A89_003548 [Geosiphon pyriformis]|nr:hypothetical protein G9A89_003548 [Geosiphon pyriformis]
MFRLFSLFAHRSHDDNTSIRTPPENPLRLILPAECLQEVFKYYENDPHTLRSCLLVDRYWCQNAVAVLYRNPFEIIREPSAKLILTFLSFLDDDVKIKLEENGLELSSMFTKTSMLNYAAVLRTLSYKAIYDCVLKIVPRNHPKFTRQWMREKFCRVVVEELCKYFTLNCLMLNELSFDTKNMTFYPPEVKIKFPAHPGAGLLLHQIRKFSCGGKYDKGNLMKTMSRVCRDLHTLELNFSSHDMYDPKNGDRTETNQMGALILAQRRLQKFVIRGSYCFLSDLMPALASQSSSLTHVEFIQVLFQNSDPLEVVALCQNLETLIFDDCKSLTNETLAPLARTSFTRLRKLIFKNAHRRELHNLIPVIENTNGSLREVRFRRREFRNSVVRGIPDMPPIIMETVAKSCPKLITFEGHIEQETMRPLVLLLENCLRLKRLAISVESQFNEFFRSKIALLLPVTLCHLTISWMGNFSASELDIFLRNCRVPLEILQLTTSSLIDDQFLIAIMHYARRTGSLKRLALSRNAQVTEEGIEKALAVINSVTKTGEYTEW